MRSMRARSAVRSSTSRGVATAQGPPSASRMHGSSWAIRLLCSPAANSSWIRTGGATGYTDYPALDDQPSSASMVALDGPRVVWRSRATSSAAPSTRTAFCQVSLARSGLDQPRSSSSAIRLG